MQSSPADNLRSPAALARFLLTATVGLGVDLWTKVLAVAHLKGTDREIAFIPGWLHFKYTENQGAVFGLGAGYRPVFLIVSVAAIAFLFYLFARSDRQRAYQFTLGLLLAGVLGNMYDRLLLGYVRDMIYALPQWPNLFPWIFNVADSLLCVGVGVMILHSLLHRPQAAEKPSTEVGY